MSDQKVSSFERLESLYAGFTRRLGRRGMFVITALSLIWGLVSGITLTRDYAHSALLVGCLAGLVAVSMAFHVWGSYARRVHAKGDSPTGVRGALLTRPALVETLTVSLTQSCTQYIMMFCIPLLVFAHAWFTTGLAIAVALSSLIDRWWLRLSRHGWYTGLVRCFSTTLATSFAFAVFFPRDLTYFYPTLGAAAVMSALPWGLIFAWRRPRRLDLAPLLAVAAIVLAQAAMHAWIRVPLLSVWLRHPALGTGLHDRDLTEVWRGEVQRTLVADAVARGEEICCLTPVVSPSGVMTPVTHEWLVDGRVIDRIQLPAVRGHEDPAAGAFRTYSCKRNLPPISSVHEVTCRVLLDDQIYVGKAAISLVP